MNKQKIVLCLFLILLLYIGCFVIFTFAQSHSEVNPTAVSDRETGYASIPKNVFIELFINAECSACPKAAFCLEELAWSYEPGRVILVEAHIWGDGYDIPETNGRYNWYVGDGIKGTPDAFFNGLSDRVQGLCCDCGDTDENYAGYQEIIDKQLAETSPVEIIAEQTVYNGKIIINGRMTNRSHSLLQNQILGGMVYYEGEESELYYLVKDMFYQQDICLLTPLEGRNFSFVSNLDLSGLAEEELEKYRSVIFVQDRLTKEVVQSFLIQ